MKTNRQQFLNKILISEEFAHSENLKKLLTYLVNCSLEDKTAKETQIAVDVFERDLTDSNQDSTIVRVNIHNLRKKLNHYYLTEGKDDELQFIIPKGRYKVEFIKHEKTKQTPPTGRMYFYFFSILAILTIILFFTFKTFYGSEESVTTKSAVWKNIIGNEKPTMIVLGDYFFYREMDSTFEKELVIRNYDINSPGDFENFLAAHPAQQSKYKPAGFSYLGYSTPFVLKDLLPVFHQEHDIEICLMSEFNNRYLQQYNIIFVGLYKTMGLFKTYFQHSAFTVDDRNNILRINDSLGNEVKNFSQNGQVENVHDDYAIAAKFPGPNHNSIFLFSSFHDSGLIECVKTFTTPALLKKTCAEIKSTCGDIPNNFEVLIKVVGANRTDINSEILHINRLNPEINYWAIN